MFLKRSIPVLAPGSGQSSRAAAWLSSLLLFLICTPFLSLAAQSEPVQADLTASSAALEPNFAIEDLDGDRLPDLASVQGARGDFDQTSYWVSLRLTEGRSRSIRVRGPAGGLAIIARDVNEDDAVDLVLTTFRLQNSVAILLNDGHGIFTTADPADFSVYIGQSRHCWSSSRPHWISVAALPPPASFAAPSLWFPHCDGPGLASSFRQNVFAANSVSLPHSGRDPPLLVLS